MNILPALKPRKLLVAVAPHAGRELASHLLAELALRGPVTVLDSGNRLQPYQIAHCLRRNTVQLTEAVERISIRRAFTCYQTLALLESTEAQPHPYLLLDLLHSFYDEQVSDREVRRLVGLCMREVRRLNQQGPLGILLSPPMLEERAFLVEMVCAQADEIYTPILPATLAQQERLF